MGGRVGHVIYPKIGYIVYPIEELSAKVTMKRYYKAEEKRLKDNIYMYLCL